MSEIAKNDKHIPANSITWRLPFVSPLERGDFDVLQSAINLVEQNIAALKESFSQYAQDQILRMGREGRDVSAYCCKQAIQTLEETRDLLGSLR
jgi:hypothetical protein